MMIGASRLITVTRLGRVAAVVSLLVVALSAVLAVVLVLVVGFDSRGMPSQHSFDSFGNVNGNDNKSNNDNNNGDHLPLRFGHSPPAYWPRYSGTRRVRLLDGIWNASLLLGSSSSSGISISSISISNSGGGASDWDSMDPNLTNIAAIATPDRVPVPSTIEVLSDPQHGYLPGYLGHRGVAAFRTTFATHAVESATATVGDGSGNGNGNGNVNGNGSGGRLQFQACSFYCRVWVNGVEIGDHTAGGYVAWWLDVPASVLERGQPQHEQRQRQRQRQQKDEWWRLSGKVTSTRQGQRRRASASASALESETSAPAPAPVPGLVLLHELFVLVDNRFNATTAPMHTGGDFWHYGGILRSVEWHDRPGVSFEKENENENENENGSGSGGKRNDHRGSGRGSKEPGVGTGPSTRTTEGDSSSRRRRKKDPEPRRLGDSTENNEEWNRNDEDDNNALPLFSSSPSSSWSLSSLWPWRLYVYPQKDLQTVRLVLQVTGITTTTGKGVLPDDCAKRLLRGLRRHERIAVYFDGDEARNALRECETDGDAATTFASASTWASLRNDRLLDLGVCSVPNPRVWSTTDPQLHTVSVSLNGAIVTERFGLRYWDIEKAASGNSSNSSTGGNRIRLNGKVLKLVGWNHHTQWPDTGAAPTEEQLDQDLLLLTNSGKANFVRGAHYPQDPRWLDRLDEHGVVVWCETLGPGVSVANLQDDFFLEQQNKQLNEMMDNAFNHASIAFWAFFNEGPSHREEACKAYRASSDAIRNRDPTRFVTYASNRPPPGDKCYDAATVISHNGYPGWYHPDPPRTYWNRIASDLRAGNPPSALGKPFLVSETGAGGIYEWHHNDTSVKWTLGYQTRIVAEDVDTAICNPNISGIALWHFFDFKVDDQWENNTHCDYLQDVTPPTCGYIDVDSNSNSNSNSNRPGGANHKGSVDFFRRPKPVFSIVASKYQNITVQQPNDDSEFSTE